MTSPFIALRSYMVIRISQWLQGFVGSCTVLLVVLFSTALRWISDGRVIVNYSKADIQNSTIYSRFRQRTSKFYVIKCYRVEDLLNLLLGAYRNVSI